MPSSCCNSKRAGCDENFAECVVCPPPPPEDNACVQNITIQVAGLDDDIRVERNGVPIVDRRFKDLGQYDAVLNGARFGFRQGDIIVLKVFTQGATYSRGKWSAVVKYIRAEEEVTATFGATLDPAPIPTTPGQEYFQFAQFTI